MSTARKMSDIGTRPDLLTAAMIMPGSDWLHGRKWMLLPVQDAVKAGVIKSSIDIKISNDAKKVFRECIVYDALDNVVVARANTVKAAITTDPEKIVLREQFSNYI